MEALRRRLLILIMVSSFLALVASIIVWRMVPIVGDPWSSVICFIIFATLTELLAVSMGEEELNVEVSPTSPIYWAATCVLGPVPAIVVCVASGVLSDSIACGSFHLARRLKSGATLDGASGGANHLLKALERAGRVWKPQADVGFVGAFKQNLQYVSQLVLIVGPAGLAYYALGGRFLIQDTSSMSTFYDFVVPFIGLVLVSIVIEHAIHMAVMVAWDPIPGASGIYAILLRMKIVLIENTLPICRAQLFLVVVALLLAYLYARVGVFGFVLAAMPVLALRDFFHNWVQEKSAYLDTITTLATYMQHYHPYTRGHLKRVADMSTRLARELKLPAESVRIIGKAGMLHDIGKVGVSEEILDKSGALNDDEWNSIKEHPVKGAEIISHLEYLEGIVDWIKYHHKWYNGAGYPATGGNGAEIPVEASILAVADSFDAMTDDRELSLVWKCDSCGYRPDDGSRPETCPKCGAAKRRTYRQPRSLDDAIDELRRGAGSQFHPQVVKAFLTMVNRDGLHINVG